MKKKIQLDLNLILKKCKPLKKSDKPLKIQLIRNYLSQLSGWKLSGKEIVKTFEFKDFHETMGFVNLVASIANRENHHPDLEVSYDICKVRYSSHKVGGLSENDFICATQIDWLSN
jgi:4a-hydroxytetrahydrobiopterin dehydratase